MRRVSIINLTLAAMFVLLVLASASSAAENPEILTALPNKISSKGGVTKFVSSEITVECKKLAGTGEFSSVRLGNLSMTFSECSAGGVMCKTAGAPAGTIEVAASIHLVAYKSGGVLALGIAVTPTATISAPCGNTLIVQIKGTVIGHVLNVESGFEYPAGTTKTLLFSEEGKKQEVKKCEVDMAFCNGKTFEYLANIGLGYLEAIEISADEFTFEKAIKFVY
jgi:hypothetical protein